jgi:hypothetical protein
VFTGKVVRPTCFGQGKVDAAEVLADSVGADLARASFTPTAPTTSCCWSASAIPWP